MIPRLWFSSAAYNTHSQFSLQTESLSLFVAPGAFSFFCELCEYLNDTYYDLLNFPNGFTHSSLEWLVNHSAEHRRPHMPSLVTWDLLPSPAWSQQGWPMTSTRHSFVLIGLYLGSQLQGWGPLNTDWPLRPSLAVLRHRLLVQGSGTGLFPSGLKAHLPRLIPATFSCLQLSFLHICLHIW